MCQLLVFVQAWVKFGISRVSFPVLDRFCAKHVMRRISFLVLGESWEMFRMLKQSLHVLVVAWNDEALFTSLTSSLVGCGPC